MLDMNLVCRPILIRLRGSELYPDINALVGDSISFAQIPNVVVKWLTDALVLHIVALALAGISAFFGLLAHVREMSMTCCSTCISGFAATVALVAFIFDLVIFFVFKSRINSVSGVSSSATIGNGVWLTLAAWVLLFFSGCFYSFGRCCVSRRPRGPRDAKDDRWNAPVGQQGNDRYADQMRLDAIKAETDRKTRQQEVGLPAFQEHEVTKPLTSSGPQYLEDEEDGSPYRDNHANLAAAAGVGAGVGAGVAAYNRRQGTGQSHPGYAQGAPGTRAVDEYYSPTRQQSNSAYPPQPAGSQYEPSLHSQHPSTYAPSVHSQGNYAPPMPTANNQYLAAVPTSHTQYPSGQQYGHAAGGTTCK